VSDDSPLTKPQGYEPCEECGAPLDPQQRYCVECAARRGNGSNPASRYFAAMSKKSRRPLTKTQTTKGSGGGSRAAAVGFFALLPIAVALGVVVGRSGSGDSNEDALLKALHQAEQQQVAAAPVVTEEEAPTTASTANKAKGGAKGAKTGGKNAAKNEAKKAEASSHGKVLSQTKNGTVHEVTGYEASKKTEEEDTKLVEENPEQTGENYIKAQQNLPDVVVVGGEEESGSSSGAELPPGVEP
jgi:hypothetical protein